MKLFLLCAVIVQGALGAPQDQWGNWNHPWGQVPSLAAEPEQQMILAAQQAQQSLQNQQSQADQAQPNLAQLQALIQQRQIQEFIRQQQIQEWLRQQQLMEMQYQQQLREQGLSALQNGLSQWQYGPQQLFEQGLQPGGLLGNFQQQSLGQLWNNRPRPGRPGPQDGEQGRRPHHPWGHLRPHKPGRGPRPQKQPQQEPEQQKPEKPDQTLAVDNVKEVQNNASQTAAHSVLEPTAQTESTSSVATNSTAEATPESADAETESENEAESTADVSSTNTDESEPAEETEEESSDA